MDVLNIIRYARNSFYSKINNSKQKEDFSAPKTCSFSFDLIKRYFKKNNHKDSFQVITDRTNNDLDLDEIFKFIDRTSSKVGQQFLYNRFRVLKNDIDNKYEEENILNNIRKDKSQLRVLLSKLNNDDAYYISSLFQDELLVRPSWYFIILILSITSLISLTLLPFFPKLIFLLIGLLVINVGIHYWNKKNLIINSISIPQVLILNNVAKELYKFNHLRCIDPLLRDSLKAIDKIRKQLILNLFSSKLQNDIYLIFWLVVELFKTLFLLEPILLFSILGKIDTHKSDIERVFNFAGKVDALCSISDLRSSTDKYSVPTISDNYNQFDAKNIYHPLIENCVTNSVSISNRSILLTGSNMSGKTSFIRTIGINYILGQTINTCFAESIAFPNMILHTSIRISDDLLNEKSYYLEEVLTIKEMMTDESNNYGNLYLLDELLKGTNTIERIAASKSILSYLNNYKNIVFAATHDIELTDMLKDEYDLFHFSEIVKNDKIEFDYKLKNGKLTSRNAIRILELYGFPIGVINESYSIANELSNAISTQKLNFFI
ncbi:MutS-related protein [Saccharicrinis fermentans]|uniref:DNA mismatch repair protein MutS n=1 Tax=Saccharicrinis fermentans DSM 9555 = JCM 21142 TaxID=869213 RepID=W7YSA4_9BACT|nr:hypothetical protein [Saccharicrinis fermentans]GAF05344.1 DNA mismatch repair protein MutS [Saccharicrinis fermentans DSM 9555 = JCM 21142]